MNKILKSVRVVFLIICVAISLLLISNIPAINPNQPAGFGNGLDYGLDFVGGTQMQLRLEHPVEAQVMAVEKGILENRLNGIGLKDIPVRPWGTQYILIQVAGVSPSEIGEIERILKQQARFEERIDGQLAVSGEEISVDLGPTGAQIGRTQGGFTWSVAVTHTPEGACRFGQVASGRLGRPVDIFVDRPVNTTLLMTEGTRDLLSNLTSFGEDRFYYGDTALHIIVNRSVMPVVVLAEDYNETVQELLKMKDDGYANVIIAATEDQISDEVRNYVEEAGLSTARVSPENISTSGWSEKFILALTGLESSPKLNWDPKGECVYNAMITGGASTLEEARSSVERNQVLLTSGNLPAKLTIESRSTTPPTLGVKFLRYSFITGLIGVLTVGLVVFIRYRRPFIVLPIIATGVSEILIILGVAALINWNLDLPAVGGIIAAVGTGVDHQIVITDETLRRGVKKEKVVSVGERIKRAFFIIFTAAATTIAAMLPILSIGAGMLKGFAFTTILGVFVGVFIARPAYAKIIEILLKR